MASQHDKTTQWLLDSDPSVRWQVLGDLLSAPAEEVAVERRRIAREGWGARLLAARDEDGLWAGGACFPKDYKPDGSGQPWTPTMPTLALLRNMGIDAADPAVVEAVAGVRDRCKWEHAGQPLFDGEVEPCINGQTLAIGSYFGLAEDVTVVARRLLGEQLEDGGWNCEAENGSVRSSFNTTICVLEGLLEYEMSGCARDDLLAGVRSARHRAEEYLLSRRLFRRATTGEIINEDFLKPAFPAQWHYDILRALDYFRRASRVDASSPDPGLADAIDLLRSKRLPDGSWPLEQTYRGATHFTMDDAQVGKASRWITLKALRVLKWYDSGK